MSDDATKTPNGESGKKNTNSNTRRKLNEQSVSSKLMEEYWNEFDSENTLGLGATIFDIPIRDLMKNEGENGSDSSSDTSSGASHVETETSVKIDIQNILSGMNFLTFNLKLDENNKMKITRKKKDVDNTLEDKQDNSRDV